MKRLLILFAFVSAGLLAAVPASAIEDPNPRGTITIGTHVAFLPGIGFNVLGEYVLFDNLWRGHLSVGLQSGYSFRKSTDFDFKVNLDPDSSKLIETTTKNAYNHNVPINARASYGLNITNRFEVHAGASLGLCLQTEVMESVKKDPKALFNFGFFTGARFFFTNNFGASLELQWSLRDPYINAGVVFKF